MDASRLWRQCRLLMPQSSSPAEGGRTRRCAARAMPKGCELLTLIGRDLAVDCGLATDGAAIVTGEVRGGVEAAWLELDRDGYIDGTLKVAHAIIDGAVQGSIYGRNISLGATARVGGEIVCERLHAAPGAVVGGRTHPSLRLNRALLRDLGRIARNARTAWNIDPAALDSLARDGLIFERGGAVFVSIFGHLELNRRWARAAGLSPDRTDLARFAGKRPVAVTACRASMDKTQVPLSVIADDVKIDSRLETAGDIRIHGDVRGDIRARLCQTGDASRIEGSVMARRAEFAGYVRGAVCADDLLLLGTARIEGPVNFGTIETRGGAHYAEGRQGLRAPGADAATRIGVHLRHAAAAAA